MFTCVCEGSENEEETSDPQLALAKPQYGGSAGTIRARALGPGEKPSK